MQNTFRHIAILLLFLVASKGALADNISIENVQNKSEEVNTQFFDIQKDKRGLMYLAGLGGVYEYDGISWRLITLPDSVGAFSLAMNKQGRIYVGGKGEIGFLQPSLKGELSYVSLNNLIPKEYRNFGERIVKIEQRKNELVFFCDRYIFVLKDKHKAIDVIQTDNFFYSSATVKDTIYVIDEEVGLMKMDKNQLLPVMNGEFLISYFMMPYQKEKLLIISPNRGMLVFDTQKHTFTRLKSNVDKYDIKSGVELCNGRMALGSVSNGCIVTDSLGKELYKVNQDKGLLGNSVFIVKQFSNGNLWLGLGRGAGMIHGRPLQKKKKICDSLDFKAHIRSFTFRQNDSLIYGGAYINPTDSVQSLLQPTIQLKEFAYNKNEFRFSYAATQYSSPQKIQYQYKLEGLNKEWSQWSKRTFCEYTNLTWGEYSLKVRAKNAQGRISTMAEYKFIVEVPWYESWWFYAGQIGFLLSLMIVAIYLYRKGKSERLAGKLIGIVIVILFEYTENLFGPLFDFLAIGIAITMFISSVFVAIVIAPMEKFTNSMLKKLVTKNVKKEDGVPPKKTAFDDDDEF